MPDAGARTIDLPSLANAEDLLGHNGGTLGVLPRDTLALLLLASGALADRLAELNRATSYASILRPTWTALAALVPEAIGQQAEVSPEDTGSHTDPQTSATVNNAGRYTAFGTSAGQWTWVDGGGLGSKLSISSRLSEFSGPFAPEVRGNIGAASQEDLTAAEAEIATKADADAMATALLGVDAALSSEATTRAAGDSAVAASVLADIDSRGVAVGPTHDPEIPLAFKRAGDDSRTWLEVLAATNGPSAHAAQLILKALDLGLLTSDQVEALIARAGLMTATQTISELDGRGVAVGPTHDPEIPLAFKRAGDDSRTWLEVLAATNGPSAHAAQLILKALDFTALSEAQRALLSDILEISNIDFAELTSQQIAHLKAAIGYGETVPSVVNVATAPPPVALSTAPMGAGREYPMFSKHLAAPVLTLAAAGSGSIYWPQLFDLRQEGIEKVGMIWSTDHASHAASGVFLATADHPDGPWTVHGRIWRDDTGNDQTETGQLVWWSGKWYLFYQGYVDALGTGNQSSFFVTIDALFPDGFDAGPVNWIDNPEAFSTPALAADNATGGFPGTGHTGYLNPYIFGGQLYAHTLNGGGGKFGFTHWTWEEEGQEFALDPQRLPTDISMISSSKLLYGGRIWAMTAGRTLLMAARGVPIPPGVSYTLASQSWDEGLETLGGSSVLTWTDGTYAAYRGGGDAQPEAIGIMKVI